MKPTKPTHCKICHRKLDNPESIARGIGPECAEKFAWMLCNAGLTSEALQISTEISTDNTVARYLRLAEQALLAGRQGDVERFKRAAKETAQRIERERLAETAWEEELQYEYGRFVQVV